MVPGQADMEYDKGGDGGAFLADYILGTDLSLFGNVSVRDPRHNSDHYMVMGCPHSASLKDHTQ